jgi:hypothetical protein
VELDDILAAKHIIRRLFSDGYLFASLESASIHPRRQRPAYAYLCHCLLTGKTPSDREYAFLDVDKFISNLPYPVDIMAAYFEIIEANAKYDSARASKACDKFEKACERHGFHSDVEVID